MMRQAERMRVVRITQEAFEQLATRAGAYIVWHEPDENVYTPTVYLGPVGTRWSDLIVDLLAVALAIVAGVVLGVAFS